MKGKDIFTNLEIDELRKLIEGKVVASRDEQKSIRRKIRQIGFYFSDFSSKKGYTVDDLENLVKSGQIKVIDRKIKNEPIRQTTNKTRNKSRYKKSTKRSTKDFEKVGSKLVEGNFKLIRDMDWQALNDNGLYCLRLKESSELPIRYQRILDQRNHKIIYIGKAEGQTLKGRLRQELEHRGPGTFFRSIGAVLGYTPMKGHLKGKSNQNNYKFSPEDTSEIIHWINNNLEMNVVSYYGDFEVEERIIKKYCPLLNYTYNPLKLQELIEDKAKCRKIARGR